MHRVTGIAQKIEKDLHQSARTDQNILRDQRKLDPNALACKARTAELHDGFHRADQLAARLAFLGAIAFEDIHNQIPGVTGLMAEQHKGTDECQLVVTFYGV